MTKESNNSDLQSFINDLEAQSVKIEKEEQRKIDVSSDFAGNSIEFDGNLQQQENENFSSSKKTNQFEDLDFSAASFFKTSFTIYLANFLRFCISNAVITSIFLALSIGLLVWKQSPLPSFSAAFDKPWQDGTLLASISVMFVIFFAIQRLSFLTTLSNHFDDFEQRSSIFYPIKKLFSFFVTELMQIILILIGAILVVLAPFFAARYFLAPAILIEENTDAIESIMKSAKRAELWMIQTLRSIIFVNFISLAFIATIFFGLSAILSNQLIIYSATFFIFSFFVLPLHASFKFVMHKKMQQFDEDEISGSEKVKFVSIRMIILAIVGVVVFVYVMALLNGNSSLSIDSILKASGISDWFSEIVSYKGYNPS